jgi:hypothetical protein
MKTLIEVRRATWGKVKEFATVRELSLSLAVQQLLQHSLADEGYGLKEGDAENGN